MNDILMRGEQHWAGGERSLRKISSAVISRRKCT